MTEARKNGVIEAEVLSKSAPTTYCKNNVQVHVILVSRCAPNAIQTIALLWHSEMREPPIGGADFRDILDSGSVIIIIVG